MDNSALQAMQSRKDLLDLYVHVDWSYLCNKTVLDIGPAYGIWSMRAVEAGASVEAIDVGKYWCRKFAEITNHCGFKIKISQSNVLDFSPGKTYDAVFYLAVWHHVPQYKLALDKVFSLSHDRIYMEGPINSKTITHKHKKFGPATEQACYWEPTEDELTREIKSRGGSILSTHYNSNRHRISLIVRT